VKKLLKLTDTNFIPLKVEEVMKWRIS